jgi:hypothetical protein
MARVEVKPHTMQIQVEEGWGDHTDEDKFKVMCSNF